MSVKSKLDKVIYGMLSVPMIFSGGCLLVMAVLALWGMCIGAGDSNGGGWLIFIILVAGIVCLPWILCVITQCILYIVGFIQFKRNRMAASRI